MRERDINIIYLIRHGNTQNNGMVYNLDQYSNGKPIEIDESGRQQMRLLGDVIAERGMLLTHGYLSDQLRAEQSLDELLKQLRMRGSVAEDFTRTRMENLRDVDGAATMVFANSRGGMKMDEFKLLTGGNIYTSNFSVYKDEKTGIEYRNETLEQVRQRMLSAIGEIIQTTSPARALVVSHGDSLRALISGLENPDLVLLPGHYEDLVKVGYLEKGGALEVILDSDGMLLASCRLPDPKSIGKRENF